MALSKNDLARELFGKSRLEEAATHARETHVITGTATTDSNDGTVMVDFGGNSVTAGGQQSVPVTTAGDIRRGDTVLATVVGASGTAKSPTVIGTPGGGDRTRSEIAAAAKSATEAETKAAEAVTKASEAEKKADSLEDTINSKADATVTLDDGSKAQLATLVKQNAAKIETKADATVTLDDGTDAELGTLVKQTAAGLTTKADATVTLDDGTTADLGTTVTQDHKSLTTVIKSQDDLSTIIREDSTGVTVGKSEDGGQTYSTARAHVSSSGSFETVLPDGKVVASMGKGGQQIGADDEVHFNVSTQSVSIGTQDGTQSLLVKDTTDYKNGGTAIVESFTGDGSTTYFKLNSELVPDDITTGYTVTVGGTKYSYVDAPTLESSTETEIYSLRVMPIALAFKTAPASGTAIVVTHYTSSAGLAAISIGSGNSVSTAGTAIGDSCTASGIEATAIGKGCKASGSIAHAEGISATASGNYSHAEGVSTSATDFASHAEGEGTSATGDASHAEGAGTAASGEYSHAEGYMTAASNVCSHAEGQATTAASYSSHAEGYYTASTGIAAHAEGSDTVASGDSSHASGLGTVAQGTAQAVFGKYNETNSTDLLIVGNGTSTTARSNAFRVTSDGTVIAAKTEIGIGTLLYSSSTTSANVSVSGAADYELLLISATTDDGVWTSQLVDTQDGTDFDLEFSDTHWNNYNGAMYVKSAVFHIYPSSSGTIVWRYGGVVQVNGSASAAGQYFTIRRVVGLGKR